MPGNALDADETDLLPGLAAVRVDRAAVDRLAARGLISAEARDAALALMEPPRRWGLWAGRLIGTVGAALVLSGIVYFFAFNWNAIPPLVKLGAIAALMAACGLAVVVMGFEGAASGAAATAAVLLLGVFLAVEGQIYQTGADAWTLFAVWAGLALPWALLAGSAAAWAVWITVAALALVLGFDQTQPADAAFYSARNLSLVALFAGALALREALAARGFHWAAPRWTRIILALPLLATVTLAAIVLLEAFGGYDPRDKAMLALVPVVLIATGVVYRRLLPDVAVLAAVLLAACAIVDFAAFRVLNAGETRSDTGVLFLMGLLTLILFAGAVAWLRAAAHAMEARS